MFIITILVTVLMLSLFLTLVYYLGKDQVPTNKLNIRNALYDEYECKEYAIQHGFDGYYNRKGDYVKFNDKK